MLKQIFFFWKWKGKEKKYLNSHDMLLWRHMSAPPIDSKRWHIRKTENKTLWGSKCSAGILDRTHLNQLVPWKLSFLCYLSVSDSHSHILRKSKASLYWLYYERTHSFFFFLISSCFTLIQVCILGVLPTPQSPQETEFPLSSAVDLGPLALHLREWWHELRILSLWDLVSDPIS